MNAITTNISLCILGVLAGIILSQNYPKVLVPDTIEALEQCIVEVDKGCPMLLGYAKDLENENAKLNRFIKTTCVKKSDSSP